MNENQFFSIQCLFCGGRSCKHENWETLTTGTAAVKGLHSNYITEDLIASQRPSTRIIHEYGVIETLKEYVCGFLLINILLCVS